MSITCKQHSNEITGSESRVYFLDDPTNLEDIELLRTINQKFDTFFQQDIPELIMLQIIKSNDGKYSIYAKTTYGKLTFSNSGDRWILHSNEMYVEKSGGYRKYPEGITISQIPEGFVDITNQLGDDVASSNEIYSAVIYSGQTTEVQLTSFVNSLNLLLPNECEISP